MLKVNGMPFIVTAHNPVTASVKATFAVPAVFELIKTRKCMAEFPAGALITYS